MLPYFAVFFLLATGSMFEAGNEKKLVKTFFFWFSVVVLILFSGLRKMGVGVDDFNYVQKFLSIPDVSYWMSGDFVYSFSSTWMEPAYIFVGALLRVFTDNYSILFLVIASLSVGLAASNYKELSNKYILSLLLFFVHTYLYRDMTQLRFAISAAIGLYLISQVARREHLLVMRTIFFASLFHITSLTYLIVYVFSFITVTRGKLILILAISVVMGAMKVTPVLLGALPFLGPISIKLTNYSNSDYASSLGILDITNIKNVLILLLLFLLWNRIQPKVRYFESMMLFMTLSASWRLAFSDFAILAARVSSLFGIVEVILLPSIILAFRQKLLITLIIIVYAFLTLYLNLIVKVGRNPYEIWFM